METRPTIPEPESCSRGGIPRRRVLIVDNSADLARALAGVIDLQDDLESVGYVSTGAEALGLALDHAADIMVMDLGLADCSGLVILDRLRQDHPDIKVVVYSGNGSAEVCDLAKSRGAVGYVRKGDDLDSLLGAIRSA